MTVADVTFCAIQFGTDVEELIVNCFERPRLDLEVFRFNFINTVQIDSIYEDGNQIWPPKDPYCSKRSKR